MSLISYYRKFNNSLGGYVEIKFSEFRNNLYPLRSKSEWTDADSKYIIDLCASGAEYAIQDLFGVKHPKLVKILPIAVESYSMSKDELISHMKSLTNACKQWSISQYHTYYEYLNSNLTMQHIENVSHPSENVSNERDLFAEIYRKSNNAFKSIVNSYLLKKE